MMTTKGSTKIANFMTPGAGFLVLGRDHTSHVKTVPAFVAPSVKTVLAFVAPSAKPVLAFVAASVETVVVFMAPSVKTILISEAAFTIVRFTHFNMTQKLVNTVCSLLGSLTMKGAEKTEKLSIFHAQPV